MNPAERPIQAGGFPPCISPGSHFLPSFRRWLPGGLTQSAALKEIGTPPGSGGGSLFRRSSIQRIGGRRVAAGFAG